MDTNRSILMKMFCRLFDFYATVFIGLVTINQPMHDLCWGGWTCRITAIPLWEFVGAIVLFVGATVVLIHKLGKDRAERRRATEQGIPWRQGGVR